MGERLGRYILGTCLGAGGAAGVYLARLDGPRGFERVLALKIVHEHLLEDADFTSMFLDEANLAVRLSHPNIVHSYELAHQGALLFTAMEYLPGKPLSRLYRRAFERVRPLPYDLIAWIGARAADALHYAHELADDSGNRLRVVHRDVSPDNLIVTYEGQVKVIDFGIARAEGRLAQTELGKVKGKFRYMSPEYALGQEFDHTLDLFALGATLYETALGLAAFEGGDNSRTLERLVTGDIVPPTSLRHDFPEELAAVIRRAIDPEPSRRYESGAQMALELDRLARLEPRAANTRLAALMRELFRDELVIENGWVQELRAIQAPPKRQDLTPTQHHWSVRPRQSRRLLLWLPAVGLGGGLALASAVWPRGPNGAPVQSQASAGPSAVVTPGSSEVVIDVAVQPPTAGAVISIAGKLLSGRPSRERVPRSNEPVPVIVEANGFEPVLLQVVPDRDHFLVVPLMAARKPLAPIQELPARTGAKGREAPKHQNEPVVERTADENSSDVIRENPFVPGIRTKR